MKKMVIFALFFIGILAILGVLTNMKNQEQVKGNVYKKDTLHPSTIKDLDDPLYQNIILPDELTQQLIDKKDTYVFFFSPECSHCKAAAPIVMPLAEELGINLQLFNLLEFENGWNDYKVDQTPTIVYYKDGKEAARFVGEASKEDFKKWFTENK